MGDTAMTPRRRVLVVAALLCLSFTSGLHAESLQGAYADSSPTIAVFKGGPFAAPPIGDLRWHELLPIPCGRALSRLAELNFARRRHDP